MRTRLALVMTVLWTVLQVTTAAQICAGWQSSAAERMACCKAAAHRCHSHGQEQQEQEAADRCCANGEASHQRYTSTDSTHLAKPVLAIVAILDALTSLSTTSPDLVAQRAHAWSSLTTPHVAPHVLFSVFRI